MEKILVLYGDIWHSKEVVRTGLSYLSDYYDRMTFVEDAKDMLTAADLVEYDLIICCKGNNLTEGNGAHWFEDGVNELTPKDLEEYVKAGGGYIALHAGNSFFEIPGDEHLNKPAMDYINFVGNYFITHPARCPVTYHITDNEHPITAGVEDFCERDEHYQIGMVAKDAHILMESTSDDGEKMPVAYIREIGKGRLCSLMPGHILSVWQNPQFQKLLINAINWCSKNN